MNLFVVELATQKTRFIFLCFNNGMPQYAHTPYDKWSVAFNATKYCNILNIVRVKLSIIFSIFVFSTITLAHMNEDHINMNLKIKY